MIIGIDGGGTKTAGLLVDRRGRVLARTRTGGTAIVGLPSDAACSRLCTVRDDLCAQAGIAPSEVTALGLGLSGIDFEDEVARQHEVIAAALQLEPTRLHLVNDGVVALWGVSPEGRTALLQHGTEVVTAYRAAPGSETLFDSLDIARLYDVRREAFVVTARMIDGRLPRTPLLQAMLTHCGVDEDRFSDFAWRQPEAALAKRLTCAGVVFDAWRAGDINAEAMVEAAAEDYALTVRAMHRRLGGGEFDLGLGGGVVRTGGEAFKERVAAKLAVACPEARPTAVRLPPEAGAVVMTASRIALGAAAFFHTLESQL